MISSEPLLGIRLSIVYLALTIAFVWLSSELTMIILNAKGRTEVTQIIIYAVIPLIATDIIYKLLQIAAPVFLTLLAIPLQVSGIILMLLMYYRGCNHLPEGISRNRYQIIMGIAGIVILYLLSNILKATLTFSSRLF